MSLRARLIAGMAVVSFVLVAVAFIIARTTEANLVDRVDQQLVRRRGRQLPAGGRPAFATAARRSSSSAPAYVTSSVEQRPLSGRSCSPT